MVSALSFVNFRVLYYYYYYLSLFDRLRSFDKPAFGDNLRPNHKPCVHFRQKWSIHVSFSSCNNDNTRILMNHMPNTSAFGYNLCLNLQSLCSFQTKLVDSHQTHAITAMTEEELYIKCLTKTTTGSKYFH